MNPLFQTSFELLNGSHPLEAEIVRELPQDATIGLGQHPAGQLEDH